MYKIIHNLALGAALIALAASLWQDWGTFTAIKRMLVSYLGFFFLGAIMALAVKLVGALEKDPAETSPAAPAGRSRAGDT